MVEAVVLQDFLAAPGRIFDVRSPGEYRQGCIPSGCNLPLFNDEQRAIVGTIYKQSGQRDAVIKGLEFVGPQLAKLVQQVHESQVRVYCWRGGWRSQAFGTILEAAGLKVFTLCGGYKKFRQWVLANMQRPLQVRVLGGMTGSGKTLILEELRLLGQQVLNLEQLASHRGSSYGMLGMPSQPTNEQFENEIAIRWASFDENRPVWVEDEGRHLGSCKLPDPIYQLMRAAPLFIIEKPLEERLSQLQRDYWLMPTDELIVRTQRLVKKLGGTRMREIVEHISTGDLRTATIRLLEYYDRAYLHEMQRRPLPQEILHGSNINNKVWAGRLLDTQK